MKKIFDWLKNNLKWVFSGIGVFALSALISLPSIVNTEQKEHLRSITNGNSSKSEIKGDNNIVIQEFDNKEGTININQAEKKNDARLEMTDVEVSYQSHPGSGKESVLDLKMLNVGDKTALLTRIEISVISGNMEQCLPYLEPSAEYYLDISRGHAIKHISHHIPGDSAERILIHLFHGCACCTPAEVKITLYYNNTSTSKNLVI